MIGRYCVIALAFVLLNAGAAAAQHPILDEIANKVIKKYQSASCEQLWEEREQEQKGRPKSEQEQQALEILRSDPQLRTEFINKIAAPIANKMFECGMIP